jgi:hypothetical protein
MGNKIVLPQVFTLFVPDIVDLLTSSNIKNMRQNFSLDRNLEFPTVPCSDALFASTARSAAFKESALHLNMILR